MRNDNAKWAPAQGMSFDPHVTKNATLKRVQPERQTLLSGPFARLLEMINVSDATGWPAPASGSSYALRLRRDRILSVNGPPIEEGWHEASGCAVSDMTDGFAVISLSGPDALTVLQRGTEINPAEPSASAARLFGSYGVILYAYGSDQTYRFHVQRAHLDGLWDLLQTYIQQASER